MIRNENTSSTPASATELVTTTPKRRVEHEFPGRTSRRREPAMPQQPVQHADGDIERHDDGDELAVPVSQDIAGEDLLEMLGALRRAVDQQDRRGGRDHVDDADQRLLRNARRPRPREREQHRGEQRERQRIAVGRRALRRMAEHERDRRAERRDLREREIDEDDVAGQHLDAEIGVDADQAERHQERRPQQRERVAHHALGRREQRGDVGVEQRQIVVRAPAARRPTPPAPRPCCPVRFARKATSRSGSCGWRTMMRTLRACIRLISDAR